MISHAKARILLKNRLAVVHKIYPFTIRLRDNSCVGNDKTYTAKWFKAYWCSHSR